MKIIKKLQIKQNNLIKSEPITIAFLGDSVTQGCFECYLTSPTSLETIYDYDNAYSSYLKKMLNLLYPNVQINIINSGINGDCALVGLSRLDRDVLRYHPDLVVVGYGLNDCCSGNEGLVQYEESLRSIIKKIQASGSEAIVLTPNMMNTNVSCHLKDELFINLAKQFSIIQNEGMLDKYVALARSVASETGAIVCDVYSKWKQMTTAGVNITELLANKLNHPIRKLHEMTAFMILECIIEK